MICPLHSDDWCLGSRQTDGSYDYACEPPGHPSGEPYYWKQPPPLPSLPGISGIAAELHLDYTVAGQPPAEHTVALVYGAASRPPHSVRHRIGVSPSAARCQAMSLTYRSCRRERLERPPLLHALLHVATRMKVGRVDAQVSDE